jgi:iron complex outermembrane receptor protein
LNESPEPVIVGFSGGGDSVALLVILLRLGYSCVAAHCNFRLRGDESHRDALFAEQFAKKQGLPFRIQSFETMAYAKTNKLSVELAARELRYRWFEELRAETGGQAIAVGHHQGDSVETFLLNLIRGAGIRGLCGIAPKNGRVVRPLLCLSRQEILKWLQEQQLDYVTDSSNFSDQYRRNFLRLRVIPLLQKINPSIIQSLTRSAAHLSEALLLYDHAISMARKEVIDTSGTDVEELRLSIAALLRFPAPETLLYELLKPYGFSAAVCREIFNALEHAPGKLFFSPERRLVKDREFLLISPRTPCQSKPLISYRILTAPLPPHLLLTHDRHTAYFDYDKLAFPLTLRQWQKGDWFVPFGMKGKKKLSDYFSDHKFSLLRKEQTYLLCSGGNILWIVGERADDRFRVTDTTRQILAVSLSRPIIALLLLLVFATPLEAMETDTVKVVTLSGITVSGSYAKSLSRMAVLPVTLAGAAFLRDHHAGSLIQTLEHIPGVQSVDIGAGFSKPAIRGMGYHRLAVVDNGIKQEGQQWGDDHPLETDPFNVEQVVLRKGPSSLLYGSDAIGGVIELIRLPPPDEEGIAGEAVLAAKSVNELLGASFMLAVRKKLWYVKGRLSAQYFADYRVPTDTLIYLTHKMPLDNRRLKNTAGKELDASLLLSRRKDGYGADYFLTAVSQSAGFFPGAHGIPDLSRLQDDGNSRNLDLPHSTVLHLRASSHQAYSFNPLTSILWDAACQWNHRSEYSAFHTHYGSQLPPDVDPDKELDFRLSTFTSSFRLRLQPSLPWKHTLGWDAQYQENAIDGYSFLLPAFRRFTSGVLWLTDFRPSDGLSLSGGLRYDAGYLSSDAFADPYLPHYLASRGFSQPDIEPFLFRSYPVSHTSGNLSASFGLSAQLIPQHLVKFNLANSFRLPTANELASNGVHHGAFRHEQGEPSLKPERGYQADFSYSFEKGNLFTVTLSSFAAFFSNYIYLRPTGIWSPLPHAGQIYRYTGARAFFSGGELAAALSLPCGFQYALDGDYVYSHNFDERIPIAFTPPASLRQTLRWDAKPCALLLQWQSVATQRRVARNEDPTSGAQLFHATLTLTLSGGITLTLAARNLTDLRWFNHLSFYRRIEIPEPGRNIQLLLRIPFTS